MSNLSTLNYFLVLMVVAEAMRVNQVLRQHMRDLPLHLQLGQEVLEVPVEEDQEMVNLQKVVIDVYFSYILSLLTVNFDLIENRF